MGHGGFATAPASGRRPRAGWAVVVVAAVVLIGLAVGGFVWFGGGKEGSEEVVGRLPAGGGMSATNDGRVATLGDEGTLTIWSADGSRLVELTGQSTGAGMANAHQAAPSNGTDDVDFSPDGSRIVVADDHHRGWVRDARTGDKLTRLARRLTDPHWSPDGGRIAAILPAGRTGFDGARDVGVWNADTGELIRRFEPYRPHELAFAPDGSQLAAIGGTAQASVHIWDLDSGGQRWRWSTSDESARTPRSIAFHPEDDRLLIGTKSGRVLLWDVNKARPSTSFRVHKRAVSSMALSRDGQKLVTAAGDNVRLWDLATRTEQVVLQGSAPISKVALTFDGNRVVATSPTGLTRVYNVSSSPG